MQTRKRTCLYVCLGILCLCIDGVTGDANARRCAHTSWQFPLFFAQCYAQGGGEDEEGIHHGLSRACAFETPLTFHIVAKKHWTVQ